MKIVLQSSKTGKFLRDDDYWTEDILAARKFPHSCDAAKFADREKLTNVQVVLVFPNGRYNVVLSISEERQRR
jgi:hypothetical protein